MYFQRKKDAMGLRCLARGVGGTETLMQTNRSMQTLTDLKVKPYDEIHISGATSGPFTSQGYAFREA